MQNLLEELKELLKTDQRFILDGNLFKNKIVECALKVDADLIALLLKNENIKRHFFTTVGDVLVFEKIKFQRFVNNKEFLSDSFTAFKSDIGLTVNDDFLKAKADVVLSFPYKDCVLEGGQSREEDRRNEIFFNTTLAPDETDTLLKPKVLTNAKLYTAEGVKHFEKFHRNENGTITNNLIIKGNNLLALHSIEKQFAGKVKLIYIDPPYNTQNDGFKYNDSFNHSTWLTFMKNRLEVARKLLSDDGAIYVNLDFHEVHYAKVLMDEIFGRSNFQREIIWRIGWLSGYKTNDNNYIRNHDSILFYSKNSNNLDFHKNHIKNSEFKKLVKLDDLKEKLKQFGLDSQQQKELVKFINHENRPEKYPIEDIWNGNEYDDLNSIAIVSFAGETVSKLLNDKEKELKGQKSEKLIQRIIESHTNIGDIILDYHLGSGTTAAVAHKMNRQYIGIEQMDYIETVAIERLKKVIGKTSEDDTLLQNDIAFKDYDQGGISKSVNWRGGGNFIYLELKKYNQEFVERIMVAENYKELSSIWHEMKARSFINYNADIAEYESRIAEFENFTAFQQKEFLIDILDKNQLYVNLSSLEDTDFACTEEEKSLNKDFYKKWKS